MPPRALCLADFGFAQYMSPWDEKHVLRGSPLYMAPEMVCRQHYDARVDLWSVGVILYGGFGFYRLGGFHSGLVSPSPSPPTSPFPSAEALFGKPPFASHSFAELEEKIRSDRAVEVTGGVELGGFSQRSLGSAPSSPSFPADPSSLWNAGISWDSCWRGTLGSASPSSASSPTPSWTWSTSPAPRAWARR